MNSNDCVLAATGTGLPLGPILLIAALLLVVGAIVLLAVSKRTRAALATLAVGALLVGALGMPAEPAQAASGSDSCAKPTPTTPIDPDPKPTPPPTPTPTKKFPDLAASTVFPKGELAVGSEESIVATVRNVGSTATTAPIEVDIALSPMSSFGLVFDHAATSVTIDGAIISVSNPVVSVSGTGTATDPFVLRIDAVLAPDAAISVAIGVRVPRAAAGAAGSVDMLIEKGTGGGERPATNNLATALLRAAAVAPACTAINDKSPTLDSDGDGVVDACDLDSDNDGILDTEEDGDRNGKFEDDDAEGDLLLTPVLGDGVPGYLDLDSDNDGILDLMEGRPFTRAQVAAFDADRNGVFDAGQAFGANGLLDALETSPDSGTLRPEFAPVRNTDGDDKPDFLDIASNGTDLDLYVIGRAGLDTIGGGFVSPGLDADRDGIQGETPGGIDTDLVNRGAPGSPYSPYSS
ncbi:thrombospondin type 3 repeat-containing protein [Leucobacter iarius]|uniref:Uncharacterized protein n=1 Tax=Leucobacter iarius TaxID=333963 RepID=A0ABN2LWR2_9MICO